MSGEELRALAEAATPGPWERDGDEVCRPSPIAVLDIATTERGRDAAFIAAANPTAILALLDEVDRLRADIAAAEQRGREDNADHGMCYISGSKALEAILDERDALRAQVDTAQGLLAAYGEESSDEFLIYQLRAALDPQ